MNEPFDIRSEELAEARKVKDAERARQDEENDTKWLMSSEQGRRYVWGLLERAGVFQSSFRPDAMLMAFVEGARNEGLRMLSLVNEHCPQQYVTMMKEAHAARIGFERAAGNTPSDAAS